MSDEDLMIIEALARVDDASLTTLIELPVVKELFEVITASSPTSAPVRRGSSHGLPRTSLRSRQRSVVGLVVASAAAVVLVLGVLIAVGSGPPTRAHPSIGRWQLAGYVTGWTESTTALQMGGLSCPDTTTCYVTGPSGTVSSGLIPIDSLWVSHDGGASWSGPNVLPAEMTFTTSLVCSADDDCMAGGKVPGPAASAGSPILLQTSDGGRTWRQTPLPAGIGFLHTISCPSATNCFALASMSGIASALGIPPNYGIGAQPSTLLASTNGGQTWSSSILPTNDTIALLDCPTATSCVAAGEQFLAVSSGASTPTGVVLTTTDSGQTWAPSAISGGILAPTALTCPTASDCFAVGSETTTVPTPTANYCTPNAPCIGPAGPTMRVTTSQFYRSSDGGATWLAVSFPTSPPQIDVHQLSCPTANECWVSGEDGVPYRATGPGGGVSSANSPVVLTTHDAGNTWTTTTPPDATTPGNSFPTPQDLAALQCPASNDCIALSLGFPGSIPALVFTYGSPSP